ncbi:MAG: poly-gamma-glutamate hydrolase family protein [Syntrophobacteraceae bacterium]
MSKYSCFEHLSANESRGADYEVFLRHGSSGIAVISIHGGAIEPGTSEVAEAVAGADHSFYTFRGIKKAGNKDLHITSTLFDEPDALEIARRSETIISIHGCSDAEEVVHVGGIDFRLRECIEESLREAGFKALNNKSASLRGRDRRNICNRCRRGMGVQLEISKGLRARMFGDLSYGTGLQSGGTFHEFIQAVRKAAEQFKISIEAVTR